MAVSDEKYSILEVPGDGTTTAWEFNFAGEPPGYISKEHIKAYRTDVDTQEQFDITITESMWLGPNTIEITPAISAQYILTIYRDTPKDKPLVNYTTNSIINEANLDKSNQQNVYATAEMVDQFLDVKATADDAQTRAILAQADGTAALEDSSAALTAATTALSTANTAMEIASEAQGPEILAIAEEALETANAASATANAVDAKATQALTDSGNALSNSQEAINAVDAATIAATEALDTANAIDGKATTALANADTAVTTANEAIAIAEAAAGGGLGFISDAEVGDNSATWLAQGTRRVPDDTIAAGVTGLPAAVKGIMLITAAGAFVMQIYVTAPGSSKCQVFTRAYTGTQWAQWRETADAAALVTATAAAAAAQATADAAVVATALAATGGAALVGVSGGGTLQTKLTSIDSAVSGKATPSDITTAVAAETLARTTADDLKYDKAGGAISGRAYTSVDTYTPAASVTIDCATGNVFEPTAAQAMNITTLTLSNPIGGQTVQIRFVQDATGGRTVAVPSGAKVSGTPSTAGNRVNWLILTYSAGGARWEGNWMVVPA